MDYQKLYESLQVAYGHLEKKVDFLEHQNAILIMEKKQWIQDKAHQQEVIGQAITAVNATSQLYLEENHALKAEIQRLKEQLNGNQH